MNWQVLSYWSSVILSGVLVGINPCALATLWFFFRYVSKNARTPGMITWAGWIFVIVTFAANAALTFGIVDPVLRREWSRALFLGSYAVIVIALAVQGILHLRDWYQYKFRDIPVDQFKVPLPVFLDSAGEVSRSGRKIFIFKAFGIALVLNVLGVAWGQDYALYVSFSQIYFSSGVILALMQLTAFLAGYLLPLFLVWTLIVRLAKFRGHGHLPGYQVAFAKIFQAVLALALAVNLGISIARDFIDI